MPAFVAGTPITRRALLAGGLSLGALALLAARGGAPATPAPTAAPSAAPSAAPAATATPAAGAQASAAPRGTATSAAASSARPSAVASAAASPAAQGLRLIPLSPAELGAPAVPPPARATAANAVPLAPAIAVYDAFGTAAAPGVFPRTIRHAAGQTELKTRPERILPLDSGELDSIVQLGLKPIGYLDYTPAQQPGYLLAART